MAQFYTPATAKEVAEIIRDATGRRARLEIRGGGSKALIGAAREAELIETTRGFSGVIDYDPAELVLTVGAGTSLAEIETLLDPRRQMLAFEPFDHGPVFGRPAGASTIGGVVAAGVAGSRRLSAGSARDHLLGFAAVSGRGEVFVGGAKVVKNVTGYDLPKVITGSWGRLAVLTEITLKVLPKPRATLSLVIEGLSDREACEAMARAMGSQAEVAAAAHLPALTAGAMALTVLRLEGFAPSVDARADMLRDLFRDRKAVHRLDRSHGEALWSAIRTARPLGAGTLWRINVPPTHGADVTAALVGDGVRWIFDWAGGLVWLVSEGDPNAIRSAAAKAGGHATLVRASEAMRAVVPFQQPPPPGVAALSARVRRAFDPSALLETGRFLDDPVVEGADAD